MKNKINKNNILKNIIIFLYIALLLMFVGVIIYLAARCGQPSMKDDLYSGSQDYEYGWITADGTEADISALQKLDYAPYEEFSLYNTLPENLPEGSSLFFRSKNIFFSVYVDGEKVYDPHVPESIFYTDAFGTRWSCIPLLKENSGKTIEIRMTKVYESSRSSIDNIRIGNSGGVIMDTIYGKITSFVTCILMLFTALLLVIADIPVNAQSHKNHELFFLGLFAFSISAWCLSETNLVQFFFDDSRMMQVVSCTALMFIPVPMMLYLNAAFGFKHKWLTPVFCISSEAEILTCWILHFLKITDIHHTMTLTHIFLGLCAVIMFSVNIRNIIVSGKNASPLIYRILRGSGFVCVSLAAVIDIIRYYRGGSTDSAMFVRIGLLIYIICYGISSLENTVKAVKLGVRAEFVSKLAYSDGLTGIGNRTAFKECLSELESEKRPGELGIIMFDVNDLKYVNDNLGHDHGDSMLICSADVIRSSFENYGGKCFRIGGDEFVVILKGDNVSEIYERGIKKFSAAIAAHNELPDKDFVLSIAHGFALYEQSPEENTLNDVYKLADQRMYDNKKMIKASRRTAVPAV